MLDFAARAVGESVAFQKECSLLSEVSEAFSWVAARTADQVIGNWKIYSTSGGLFLHPMTFSRIGGDVGAFQWKRGNTYTPGSRIHQD
eukprot:6699851-Pyramimonas_sp.AAC.1